MQTIDQHFVIQQVRQVGASLRDTFSQLQPAIEWADVMVAFRRIDGAASQRLKDGLAAAYPGIGWLDGELNGAEAWQNARTGAFWACDAIDGAVQYLRAIPQWCISLTLVEQGQAVFAAIFDVMHDELFHAAAGGGAYLNGRAIHVNARSSHVGSVLASSQPPFVTSDANAIAMAGRSLSALLADAFAVRNLGPTSLQLAYVACGRLDGFWEYGEDTFNCLGGSLLVREAGGHSTDVHGAPYGLQADSVVAASAVVHQGMLRRLADLSTSPQPG